MALTLTQKFLVDPTKTPAAVADDLRRGVISLLEERAERLEDQKGASARKNREISAQLAALRAVEMFLIDLQIIVEG